MFTKCYRLPHSRPLVTGNVTNGICSFVKLRLSLRKMLSLFWNSYLSSDPRRSSNCKLCPCSQAAVRTDRAQNNTQYGKFSTWIWTCALSTFARGRNSLRRKSPPCRRASGLSEARPPTGKSVQAESRGSHDTHLLIPCFAVLQQLLNNLFISCRIFGYCPKMPVT